MNPLTIKKKQFRLLREYQEEGVDFLCDNPFAGLFIYMGLGKTAITLHALLEFEPPTLLVGPIRVIETVWEKEAREWLATRNLKFSLLRGSKADRAKAAQVDADVYLVNPELLEEALHLRDDYQNLVIDESSMFKNPSAKRFKTLRKHLARFSRRVILTGTPAPNSLMDLWSQSYIIDRGEALDTSFSRFRRKYFYPTDWQGYVFKPHDWAMDKITEAMSEKIFRVTAHEAWQEIAGPLDNVIELTLPLGARKLYDQMEQKHFARIEGEVLTASTAAVALGKLRQFSGGFVYDEDGDVKMIHDEKIKAAKEIVDETGSPIILIYQYKHELAALQKAFPKGVKYSSEIQADWDAGKIDLMFLHPQSGGHGLNLQFGGHVMIIYSGSFSLEQMEQTKKRIDRYGQQNQVIFHHLIVADTVDELLMDVQSRKSDNQNAIMDAIQAYGERRRHVVGSQKASHSPGGARRVRKVHPRRRV